MSRERIDLVFTFEDTLANGEMLFRTKHGTLMTEDMIKVYISARLEAQFSSLNSNNTHQFRLIIEPLSDEAQQ